MSISRRFGARATGLRVDPFRAARWKLTLLYLAIITTIVAVLSSALYEFHSHDVSGIESRRAVPELSGDQPDDSASIGEYLERLGRSIIFADIITIVVGGGLSYVLAARTLRPIKESVDAEQKFFANAAHDLRTPLAVMRTEAEVALRSDHLGSADARKVIASSLEELGRMSTMVEQMLDLARSGSVYPDGHLAMRRLDLGELARATTARMERRALDRGIRLAIDASAPATIQGNAFALERAAYNVLENAISYTPSGGSVTVRVQRHAGHVILSVSDTGIGIPPQDLPHLGEPFFRGDRARSMNAEGAGLGLAIVRATVAEHRGSFQAESRPRESTTVSLRFPAA